MTRCILLLLVAAPLGAAAPVPKEDDSKKEAEKLQGTWKVVAIEEGGMVVSERMGLTVTFEKDIVTISHAGQAVKGTVKLDPAKKPKAIDVTITQGKRDEDKGKVLQGIYELDKDRLRWCTSDPGEKERPTEFATKAGGKCALFTLKKENK